MAIHIDKFYIMVKLYNVVQVNGLQSAEEPFG